MSDLFNPFHSAAAWLVSLLPAGSGDLAIGSTAMLGILLVSLSLIAPICLVGAVMERYAR